jgi:hypothetical protein
MKVETKYKENYSIQQILSALYNYCLVLCKFTTNIYIFISSDCSQRLPYVLSYFKFIVTLYSNRDLIVKE